uniref:Uncharacterized protein n=1 Tax=uncultured marine virus TaxID=186617 RepID=A0A0F7LAB4_9VIRU|nr:hypothetical protein [uncultured marine virus]
MRHRPRSVATATGGGFEAGCSSLGSSDLFGETGSEATPGGRAVLIRSPGVFKSPTVGDLQGVFQTPGTGVERMALVLTRKKGQAIAIGDAVVTIGEVSRGGLVRVLIDAPRETRILRTELLPPQNGAEHDGASGGRGTDTEQRSDGGGDVSPDERDSAASGGRC